MLPESVISFGGLSRVVSVGERDAAKAVVLVLHGFQMEPSAFSPFAHSMGLPAWYLLPEAPLAADVQGRAWWHIDAKMRDLAIANGPRDFAVQHPPDLPRARACLDALLYATFAAAGERPVVVVGFSQGGMLACDTLVRRPRPVAALALLSASRIAFDEWQPHLAAGNVRGLRVLVSHGETDADLAFAAGKALEESLAASGADVTWVPFPQGHEVPLVVWRRLRKVIERLVV